GAQAARSSMRAAATFVALSFACGCGSSNTSGGAPDLAAADAPDFAGAPVTWEPRASLPAARQETAVVALDGKVYVIGGFDQAQQIVATVEAWDPATDTWTARAPLPAPVHHANAAAVAGKIYVAGALQSSAFTAVGSTWAYDPAANTWSARASM